jgi:hypothetical protein
VSLDFDAMGRHASSSTGKKARKQAIQEQNSLEGPSPKTVRRTAHQITSFALWFAASLIAIIISVRFWHLIGPEQFQGMPLQWLSAEDLQGIDKMLFSSAFGGAALAYIKHVMIEGAEQDARDKRNQDPNL